VGFDIVQHFLEPGAAKIGSGIAVVDIEFGVEHPMLVRVTFQECFLGFDAGTDAVHVIFSGNPEIQRDDFFLFHDST